MPFRSLPPVVAVLASTLAGVPAAGQSFDCAKAEAADEKAVCASGHLSALDDEMAALYRDIEARALMGTRGAVRDAQRAFLEARKACGADEACIGPLYEARIADLEKTKEAVGQGAAG